MYSLSEESGTHRWVKWEGEGVVGGEGEREGEAEGEGRVSMREKLRERERV